MIQAYLQYSSKSFNELKNLTNSGRATKIIKFVAQPNKNMNGLFK